MAITVLQWNISYTEDIERVTDFIESVKPDIVCLQELTLGYQSKHPDTGAYVAERLDYHSYFKYGLAQLPDGGETSMGNGVFSRFPVTQKQQVVLQEGVVNEDGHVLQAQRLYLQACVDTPLGVVGIGTAHLLFHPRFQTTPHKFGMVEK